LNRSKSAHPRRGRSARYAWLLAAVPITALGFAAVGSAAPGDPTDLKITKTDSPDPVRVGSTLTYTIRVDNRGPLAATGVTVTDSLPKGVDFLSASPGCALRGQKVTCSLGDIPFGGVNYSGSSTITIAVIPRQAGSITNTASVKSDQKDLVPGNDTATTTTRVLAPRQTGTATCRGIPATIVGTRGDDNLVGTGGPDVIAAFGGNDTIASLAGRDLVCAGNGNDYVGAGSAADRVFGGAGKDRLLGRGGADVLKGNGGNDVLKGNRGSDRLRGGRGFDICKGGPGLNSIRGCER
jgi:uncharacterized repeat protein (TIGR01451 family)